MHFMATASGLLDRADLTGEPPASSGEECTGSCQAGTFAHEPCFPSQGMFQHHGPVFGIDLVADELRADDNPTPANTGVIAGRIHSTRLQAMLAAGRADREAGTDTSCPNAYSAAKRSITGVT